MKPFSWKELKVKEISLIIMQNNCPECDKPLHKGQHKYADGLFNVSYCKVCGYRKEVPMEEK